MSQHKLLLADDSVTIQKVVNLTFADEGIEVVTVGDGDAAVSEIASFQPDLVMADVNMPGLNGYQVCERIKSDPATSHVPVILLVGSFEPFDEDEARRVGADDYMTKPFQSIRQLVNKVTDLLNGKSDDTSVADDFVETAEFAPRDGENSDDAPAAPSVAFVEETLRMEKPPVDFGDSGMDDEMIEASPAAGFTSEESLQDDQNLHETSPLTNQELKDFDLVGVADAYDDVPAAVFAAPAVTEPGAESEIEEVAAAEEPAVIADEPPGRVPYFQRTPVSIDEVNPLDLPPLVEETGIRPLADASEAEPVAETAADSRPVVSEELIAQITARVADKLAERIARALDSDVVREVTQDVLREIDQTKDLS